MSGMNQYTVYYLDPKAVGIYSQTFKAHRVEGWREDYAFFGHERFPGEVTTLIPRALVRDVAMDYDGFGNEPVSEPGGAMERQASAFYQEVDRWRATNPGLSSVVSHEYVLLTLPGPDELVESKRVTRNGWGPDEASALVEALADDLGLVEPTDEDLGIAEILDFSDVVSDPRSDQSE